MIAAMPPVTAHDTAVADRLVAAARTLSAACDSLSFAPPVAHVYNPLSYAWAPYERYLRRFGTGRKRAVFLGMNPGPVGMMPAGSPLGEVAAVRDWVGIEAGVQAPGRQHPKRPIEGFACRRSEVSGRRLWGWAADRFGSAEAFFAQCLVLNWCPLVFLEESGRNRTPEQLPAAELAPLQAACDAHLREAIAALHPDWAIGIGGFVRKRLETALSGMDSPPAIGQVLHPSPASPAANRGWAQAADRALEELGVFA